MFLSKAQCAEKGSSLCKRCNAAEGHQANGLRLSVSASLDSVTPLAKGITISCETRLARNADTLTEPVNIVWLMY